MDRNSLETGWITLSVIVNDEGLMRKVKDSLAENQVIGAIKAIRTKYNIGLKEAMAIVNALRAMA